MNPMVPALSDPVKPNACKDTVQFVNECTHVFFIANIGNNLYTCFDAFGQA